MNLIDAPREVLGDLAWLARKARAAHPRGRADNGGRWYPDEVQEGGTPGVRSPSRTWPWSYAHACRARAWCRDLPQQTLGEDAQAGLALVRSGGAKATPDVRRWLARPENVLDAVAAAGVGRE